MASTANEIVVHSNSTVGADVEALVQAAVSVLSNDMQLPTQNQLQEQVQVVMESNPDLRQERLYMCTDCNLAFYGENGEAEWQWHLKQHQPYKCDLCSESFEQKHNLAQHMRTHSIQMPFICEQCGSAYSLKANLQQHMKTHEVSQQLKCPQCEESFIYQSHLDRHFKTVHSGEPLKMFACEICGKKFTQQKNLVQHAKIHSDSDKPYKCNECPASYSYKCHLTRHLIIHTGEKPYRCKFCGKSFNRNAHLVRHRKIHSEGEKQYRCEECNFAFWEKSDLQRHIRSHAGNRPFKCDFCEQTFTWRRYLLKHLNIHHKDDTHVFCPECCECVESEAKLEIHKLEVHSNKKQLTHTCLHCGEEFYFKYKLDEHTFQHTGIKAHKCEKCPASFVSRKELERHVADHSMEVSFHCNTCDQNFASIQDLQLHVTLHAGRGKFQCNECSMTFKWKSQLKAHMISHSETRAFPCPNCQKDFKRVKDLKRHQRIYHEMKPPYNCSECNLECGTPFNLLKHEKSVHSAEAVSQTARGYECPHCSGAFKLKEDLDSHMKIHQPKPYICSTCSKEFSKLKFIKKHLSIKHGIEEGVENEHYTKIVVKAEMEENGMDLEDGEINEMENVTYDGIQEMAYETSQEEMYGTGQDKSFMEMQTAEPIPAEIDHSDEMQRIEIVPLPRNQGGTEGPGTQIIIQSVQGTSQANVEQSQDIASNVSIPKVVMIRGGQSSTAVTNQTQAQFGQHAAPQAINKVSTESILLQLAQQAQEAQIQKQISMAQSKQSLLPPLQTTVSMASKLTTTTLRSIINASLMPASIPTPQVIKVTAPSVTSVIGSGPNLIGRSFAPNVVQVSTPTLTTAAASQTAFIEASKLPTPGVQTIPAVSANLPELQSIVGTVSEQASNNHDQPVGDYVNVISRIPSVVADGDGEEEEVNGLGGGDVAPPTVHNALGGGDVAPTTVQVEVLEGSNGKGEDDVTVQGVDEF